MKKSSRSARPSVKITYNTADKMLELFGLILITGYWLYLFKVYSDLPDILPSHFNVKGELDSYSKKAFVWGLPRTATYIYIAISVLSLFPKYVNYMVDVTKDNAAREYRKAFKTLQYLKIIIVTLFFTITSVLILNSDTPFNASWLLLLMTVSLCIPSFFYWLAGRRKEDNQSFN